jgi:hypothetical protein
MMQIASLVFLAILEYFELDVIIYSYAGRELLVRIIRGTTFLGCLIDTYYSTMHV